MDEREYWAEVMAIAALLSDEEALEADYGEDYDTYDVAHEIVDGHQFIIYYANAAKVMQYSKNQDAYWDQFGQTPDADSWWGLLPPLAYAAMLQDIWDQVGGSDEFGSANPKRRRAYGRARRNYSKQQHQDLYENWAIATQANTKASREAYNRGNERQGRAFLMRASEAGGRMEANRAAKRDEYYWAQKAAREYASKAEDFLFSEGVSNPPDTYKWKRQEVTSGGNSPGYVMRGSVGEGVWIIAYKPRKYPYSADRAAEYEAQSGRKVPKGTKWLLSYYKVGVGQSVSAHKTLQSAKAAGRRLLGAPNPKRRKTKKRRR